MSISDMLELRIENIEYNEELEGDMLSHFVVTIDGGHEIPFTESVSRKALDAIFKQPEFGKPYPINNALLGDLLPLIPDMESILEDYLILIN